MQDRRENDIIILEELRNLQKDVSRIDINLALNTQETSRLAKYQELMNGRVAGHEARMQVVQAAQAITATAVAEIKLDKKKEEEAKQIAQEKQSDREFQSHDKWRWTVIGILISLSTYVILYLIKFDILKKIFIN
jgi:hypothetical protein